MPENRAVTNNAQNEKSPRRSFGPGGGGRMSGERANNFSKAIGDLMGYCRKYLPAIVIAVVSAAAGSILNLIGPGKVADMTNLITQGMMGSIDVEAVVRIAALLVCLYGLGWLFSVIQGVIMATVTQRVSKSLRTDISQKINRLPLRYFDQTSTGNILSRVTNDVDTIGQTLNQSVGTLVTASTMFVGSLVMMFYTNAVMAISAVLAAIVGFGLMMLIISHSQKFFRKQQQELGALNGHIEETYSGHSVVKAYNGEKAAKEEFHRMNQQLYQCAWKSQFMSGLMQPLMGFVGNLGYVAVCVTGAVLTMNGTISFSVIVAFMLYVRLFTQPLSQLAQAATSLQSAAAASERVFDFLGEAELEDESKKSLQLTRVAGNVEFEHIHFGYDEGKPIMREFYCIYENAPEVLAQAMTINWTQNVIILEAELTLQERAWYIRAVRRFGWSKLELQQKIATNVHLEISLDFVGEVSYTEEKSNSMERTADDRDPICVPRQYSQEPNSRIFDKGLGGKRRNDPELRNAFMRMQEICVFSDADILQPESLQRYMDRLTQRLLSLDEDLEHAGHVMQPSD